MAHDIQRREAQTQYLPPKSPKSKAKDAGHDELLALQQKAGNAAVSELVAAFESGAGSPLQALLSSGRARGDLMGRTRRSATASSRSQAPTVQRRREPLSPGPLASLAVDPIDATPAPGLFSPAPIVVQRTRSAIPLIRENDTEEKLSAFIMLVHAQLNEFLADPAREPGDASAMLLKSGQGWMDTVWNTFEELKKALPKGQPFSWEGLDNRSAGIGAHLWKILVPLSNLRGYLNQSLRNRLPGSEEEEEVLEEGEGTGSDTETERSPAPLTVPGHLESHIQKLRDTLVAARSRQYEWVFRYMSVAEADNVPSQLLAFKTPKARVRFSDTDFKWTTTKPKEIDASALGKGDHSRLVAFRVRKSTFEALFEVSKQLTEEDAPEAEINQALVRRKGNEEAKGALGLHFLMLSEFNQAVDMLVIFNVTNIIKEASGGQYAILGNDGKTFKTIGGKMPQEIKGKLPSSIADKMK